MRGFILSNIFHLYSDAQTQSRLLERTVLNTIAEHPDKDVALRWQELAKETISRYPGPPLPSQPNLDLNGVDGLTPDQIKDIESRTEQWLSEYFKDVLAQLMNVHRDLLTLQKQIAEFEVENSRSGKG